MALSQEKIQQLEDLKSSIEEWIQQRLDEIDAQAEFLKSVDVSVSSLGEQTQTNAADEAQTIIDSILTE